MLYFQRGNILDLSVNMSDLVSQSVNDSMQVLLKKSLQTSKV